MKSLPSPVLTPVNLASIAANHRLRPVSDAGVAAILASVDEIGRIKDPIHVRRKKDGSLVLLAGGHRLAAYGRMGVEEADVWLWSGISDDVAALIEIDDNLAGAEMNALDTAVFLATRKAVYERLHPETRATAFKGNRHTGSLAADMMSVASFATATAEKFGMTDRHVRRMIAAGSALAPDQVRALRQAPRQVTLADLMEIAKIGAPTDRYSVVERLASGRAKSAAEARRQLAEPAAETGEKDPVEDAFQGLVKLWERVPMAARRRFVTEYAADLEALLADRENGED